MLRQEFMKKYRTKSKFDSDRFEKEDEGYLLKLSRPLKPYSIKALNKEKLNKFIEDVLTNRRISTILFDSNANIEIKSSQKLIKNFQIQNSKYLKQEHEKIESSVVKKRSRKEAYVQMRTEIDEFENKKHKYIKNLLRTNFRKYLLMKEELKHSQNDFIEGIREKRIESFRRAFDDIKTKFDDNNGKTVETDFNNYYCKTLTPKDKRNENYYLFRNNFINCSHNIRIPKIKFNIKNVYSRLYNNKVLLTSKTEKNIKKNNLFKSSRHNIATKNKILSALSAQNIQQQMMNKTKFRIKNVFKANGGKEFTIKVTNEMFKKCLDKYSGGPETIPNLKEDMLNLIQEKKLDVEGLVNFYDLVEKKTGDSYLHIATKGNYFELVKYFILKGSDINKQNFDGDTPLHLAVRNKNMKIIKILLDHKAKLDIPNKEGEIPFDFFNFDMKKKFGLETKLIINPIKGR
jgi:hypothetical protein